MDLSDLKYRAAAARAFSVAVPAGGERTITFAMRVPTKLESSVAYAQASVTGSADRAAMLRWQRAMLLLAITGWTGPVLASDVVSDLLKHDAEPLQFAADAVPLLLDAQPDWEEALTTALLAEIARRKSVEDSAAKN